MEAVDFDHGGKTASWTADLAGRSALVSAEAGPSVLLSPVTASEQEILARLRSDGTNGFLGFVFGWKDKGNFLLFDWNRTTTNHPSFGTAPVGMRLRSFHLPNGQEPDGADFWSSPDPSRVTVLATNDVPWVPALDYDLTLRLLPDRLELILEEGGNTVATWPIPGLNATSGPFGFFANSIAGATFGELRIPGAPPVVTGMSRIEGDKADLNWINGRPPFVIEASQNLESDSWFDISPATLNFSHRLVLPPPPVFLRVRGATE